VVILLAGLFAAAPLARAAGLIVNTTTSAGFLSGYRFPLHYANGHYWALTDHEPPGELVLYSSPDGVTWSPQGSVFSFGPQSSLQQWASRYSYNTVIALAYDGDAYYRKGTLNVDGTVTWDVPETSTGQPDAMGLNAAIVSGRPFMWRASLLPASDPINFPNGTLRFGDRLSPTPIAWNDSVPTAPALSPTTEGEIRAGAVFWIGPGSNDLMILRATTRNPETANAHRLVAIKYDGDTDTYDPSWFNVSLCCGLTEDDSTKTFPRTGGDQQIQIRFAAVQDSSFKIHAFYVNKLSRVVHYRKDAGWNDNWTRLNADVTGNTANRIAVAAASEGHLYLFYTRSVDGSVYYRHYDGAAWGAQQTLKAAGDALNGSSALSTLEFASGCNLGVGWHESDGDAWFEKIPTSDCPPVALYRSVGITATNLNTGLETVGISGPTATFSGPLPPNIGVGDVLAYNSGGARLAFIHGRTSSNVFTVADKNGGTPTAAPALTPVAVYRAYTSLANWESQIENPNINEPVENDVNPSTNLVTANTIMRVACYGDGEDTGSVLINSWTTGPSNYIKIFTPTNPNEVGARQRHAGKWSTSAYRLSQGASDSVTLLIGERYVRVDGLQIESKLEVFGQSNGIHVGDQNSDAAVEIHISNSIFRMTSAPPSTSAYGIGALNDFGDVTLDNSLYVAKIWNNIIYDYTSPGGGACFYAQTYGTVYAYNNTCVGGSGALRGIARWDNVDFYAKNNISIDAIDPYVGTFHAASTDNVSDIGDAPGSNPINGEPAFVNKAGDDYHLASADTVAQDAAANLSSDSFLAFSGDIDGGGRSGSWDVGADDVLATTAVELVSFTASGFDRAVELGWETGSELENLGFHVYRAIEPEGPYERITSGVVPGLGSSPEGAKYGYLDSGLTNGVTYYYKLEDIETTGRTEQHGPISATPEVGSQNPAPPSLSPPLITYGDASAVAWRVLSSSPRQMVLELETGGFYVEPQSDGTVRLSIPDFIEESEAGAPALPVKRAWVEALAGLRLRVASADAVDILTISGLRPKAADSIEVVASRSATAGVGRRRRREGAAFRGEGLFPEEAARIVSVGFQGERKKALLELAPLRWDRVSGDLLLARRLTVRLVYAGLDAGERSLGGPRGRKHRESPTHQTRPRLARLSVREKGLYRVSYEEVFRFLRGREIEASSLRLSRQGKPVAFHLEPNRSRFGPGSALYFLSEGAALNPYGQETVYELELAGGGTRMEVVSAAPSGPAVGFYWQKLSQEENRYYQAGLVEAPDPWLWDVLLAPTTKSYRFELRELASAATEPSLLELWAQGVSDFEANPDHHLRVLVNGSLVAEASWDGKEPRQLRMELPPGLLGEGQNQLDIENVGDTAATYSMVMLNKWALSYPRLLMAEAGKLEGSFRESGEAAISALSSRSHLLDLTEERARWLSGMDSFEGRMRFKVEAGSNYLAVSPEAVLKPEVERPLPSHLKSPRNRSDYLVVAPRAFQEVAQPLLDWRRSEGLAVRAVALEDVYSEFGFGESRPEALQEFLAYAYHHWRAPSPRYVLLLGDATYDFKNYLGTGVRNQVPPLMVKTTYLWTASDPAYAAVNGEDILPDVAIGRLPAATVDEARVMVEKILAYERSSPGLAGPVALVADNADDAGILKRMPRRLPRAFLPPAIPARFTWACSAETQPAAPSSRPSTRELPS
jgi:hypothetical protein